MMKYIYSIVLVIIVFLVALFASQNAGLVTVSFFTWSASGSLSLMLVVALVTGLLIGIFIMLPSVIGGFFKQSITKHKLKSLEKKDKKNAAQAESSTSEVPAESGAEEPK